jgi:hypothetical protein
MKKISKIIIFLTLLFSSAPLFSQLNIPNTTTVVENFNLMSTSTTGALPSSWRIHRNANPTFTGGTQDLGVQASSGSPATGATYNWGSSTTERSPGVMTSGSFASPSSLMGWYRNTNVNNLNSLTVSYTLERYRINSAAASVQFFYSTDGSTWTAFTSGDIATSALPTGTSAYSFTNSGTPSSTVCGIINKTGISITGLNIATNGSIYLRWNLNTTGSNSQGIGIDDINVTATFASTPVPTITGSATTSAFTTTYGTNSSTQSFGVSGSNLTADLLATSPTGFDVSSDGITFGSTATFTTSAGSASGTLRIRLKATANAGNYNSSNIILSSTGAVSVNITTPASGNTVSTKSLTITGLTFNNKVYDGTNTISVTGTPTYVGLVNGESFSVGGSVSWVFSSVNVGTNITLTRTGSFTTPTSNYTVTQPTPTANITKATQSITFENFPFKCSYDIDFSPNATSNSGLTLTYTSSDPNVATIVANKVHVVGNGITTITASQPGNGNYFPATDVSKDLVVKMSISTWTFESLNFSNTGTAPTFGGGSTVANLGDYTTTSNITGFHSSNLTTWQSQNPGSIGNGSTKSLSASNWSVNDYFQFKVSTLGYDSILLTFEQTSSNTGPREFKLQYSFDGSSYTDVSNYTVPYFVTSGTPYAWSTASHQTQSSVSFNFKMDVNFRDKTQIFFRLLMRTTTSINGGVVSTTGTSRIDNITIMGDYYTVPLDLDEWIKNNPKPQIPVNTKTKVDCDQPPTYYDLTGRQIDKLQVNKIYIKKTCGKANYFVISEL